MKFVFRFPLVLVLTTALLHLFACSQEGIKEQMVRLDQAFIPVFYHVHQNDGGNAQKSILLLDHRWESFSNKYKNTFAQEADWVAGFNAVTNWLEQTDSAIDRKDFYSAAVFLDHLRYEMAELRAQKDIFYYLDYVWDFEASLEVVTEIATDPALCQLEWNEFAAEVEVLNQAWEQLQKTPYDAPYASANSAEQLKVIAATKSLEAAIEQFNQSLLQNSDRAVIAKESLKLTANYWQFLSAFGDFDSSMSFYAAQ